MKAAELLACVAIRYLSWDRVKNWFQQRSATVVDPDHLHITLHEKLTTGEHRVVYGLFNKSTSTFVDGESITAKQIDPEIARLHGDTPVVVYS